MKVLWLDDDLRTGEKQLGDVAMVLARSCKEASKVLERKESRPDWVIVDFVVPQDGWGTGTMEMPGIDFIKFLTEEHKDIGVAAYGIAVDSSDRKAAMKAGAKAVFEKTRNSLWDILAFMKEEEKAKSVDGEA